MDSTPQAAARNLDGAELRRRRVAAGLTQQQLASRTGRTRGEISHWENGHWGCRPPQLTALAAALGVDPEQLMPAT